MHDVSKYKTELESQLSALVTELKTIADYNQQTDDWEARPVGSEVGEADENVGADVVEEWNERRGIVSQLETRYRNIQHALRKIEDGSYGVCEVSGELIEADRLDANPAARTCKAHLEEESQLPLA